MANWKKLAQGAAGAAGAGEALNVEDVFSTYLYTGTSSAQTITNGIDLAGEGGLVWTKNRDTTGYYHNWIDTERGISNWLRSDSTNGNISTFNNAITSFNSDGYSLGTDTYAYVNNNNKKYASWTFRKAPKFFDVVTYTGTGSARTVSHNLGSVPGMIIIKGTDTSYNWYVYHRENGTNPNQNALYLNSSGVGTVGNNGIWNSTTPTSTVFTVGNSDGTNEVNKTYVAYIFAHNDGDGDFGSTADQDVIKCGSYTGTGSSGNFINLGFEPQWVLLKNTTTANRSWAVFDNMRGVTVSGSGDIYLEPNTANADANPTEHIDFNARGFTLTTGAGTRNASSNNYIYMAIRRGPMAVPESATDVFAIDDRSGGPPNAVAGFPVDMAVFTNKTASDNKYTGARLIQGKRLYTNLTSAKEAVVNLLLTTAQASLIGQTLPLITYTGCGGGPLPSVMSSVTRGTVLTKP